MDRRSILTGIGTGAGLLTGCLGDPAERASSPTPEFAEPPSCPDFPSSFEKSAIRQFVVAFEGAYRTRVLLQNHDRIVPPVQFIGLRDTPPIEAVDSGYIVRLVYHLAYKQLSDEQTPEVVHADLPTTTVGYYLDEKHLKRVEVVGDTEVDPRENGDVVECSP